MHSFNARRPAVLLGALCLVPGGAALAAGSSPTSAKTTISIKGGPSFQVNAYVKDSVHFVPGTVTVRSGTTVTMSNASRDPHTLSIVKASDLPRTQQQLDNCAICNTLSRAHGVDPNGPPPTGPPPKLLVDVGAAGFDAPGDSIFVGPKGRGSTVTFRVSAKPGAVLHFMCIIHPWMQGRLLVK